MAQRQHSYDLGRCGVNGGEMADAYGMDMGEFLEAFFGGRSTDTEMEKA